MADGPHHSRVSRGDDVVDISCVRSPLCGRDTPVKNSELFRAKLCHLILSSVEMYVDE